MNVGCTRYRRNLLPKIPSDIEVSFIRALHLDIDGCGHAEVQNAGHHVGRLEIERHRGKGLGQRLAQMLDIGLRRIMVFVQRNEDFSIEGTYVWRETKCEANWVLGKTDIVEDQIKLIGWDEATDLLLNLAEEH